MSTKANHSEGRTHSGSPQHNSRQGVTSQTGFFRLAPEPTILSDTNEGSGSVCDRSFCKQNQSPASRFYSYKPHPEAEAIDALIQPWAGELEYAFPPFNLVARCLWKVIHEGATITLVCPVWPTQSWYAQLLPLVVATPILLPTTAGLLMGPQGQEHPLVNNKTLLLAGWRVSGKIANNDARLILREKLNGATT